ncbi:deoxycytidylate deaminase [Lyticum sinuosum]|uniref:dCMP deaminase family protein n=1 Tax=Lyticum sinuosum TaxID=1332059 RepID=A0AAE4VME9_9RICK|nr:dCMP deaminase family protein [Lyticum sinuosum]MDZ5761439.1 dCMP deaminase family protein [Lyticum sinuosum]
MHLSNDELITRPMSWDEYFITIAYVVGMKSKDPSTKIGAVIVSVNHEIISTGYNGLPRGIVDYAKYYKNKEYKYIAGNHAEENAIINAARSGVSTNNCMIYVPWFPCAGCTRMIIQSGIKKVIYHKHFPGNKENCPSHWQESMSISKTMLDESRVKVKSFNGNISNLFVIFQGKKFNHLMKEE